MAETTFDDITERLDEIIAQVRSKDTSLERSLDLFDEAIELGSRAVDMVDSFELSPREADMLVEKEASEGPEAGSSDAEVGDAPTAESGAQSPHADGSADASPGADSGSETA